MKSNIKLLLCTIFLVTTALQAHSQSYRRVDWLHGMGGGPAHWSNYSTRFGGPSGDRQMTSTITSYTPIGGIDDINASITTIPPLATNNIGIGHSLGGLVCRNFEAIGNPVFDGVITVHSPNMGADLAHSVNNGEAEEFLQHVNTTFLTAINDIEDVLGLQFDILNVMLGGLEIGLNAMLASFFDIIGFEIDFPEAEIPSIEEVQAQIEGAFAQLNNSAVSGVIDDLDPATGFIANLNSFNSIPRIEVYGHESNHEFLRLGCSKREAVWTKPLVTTDAYDDSCLKNELDRSRKQLWWARSIIIAELVVPDLHDIFGGNAFQIYRAKLRAINHITDARNLIESGLENGWEDLIGTSWVPETTTQSAFSPVCQAQINSLNAQILYYIQLEVGCQHPGGGGGGGTGDCDYSEEIAELEEELYAVQTDPSCIITIQVTTLVPTDDPTGRNDGFILESAMTTGNALATYQNAGVGVNHMEVLNHPEMWKNFNLIFNSPTFFNTPPR